MSPPFVHGIFLTTRHFPLLQSNQILLQRTVIKTQVEGDEELIGFLCYLHFELSTCFPYLCDFLLRLSKVKTAPGSKVRNRRQIVHGVTQGNDVWLQHNKSKVTIVASNLFVINLLIVLDIVRRSIL